MNAIFLDTETNGLNSLKHYILEVAFKILDVKTGKLRDQFHSLVSLTQEEWARSDPESLAVNGFFLEELKKSDNRKTVGEKVIASLKKNEIQRGNAVFICQNPSFDRAFFSQLVNPDEQEKLFWPYHWLDLASMYWCQSIQFGLLDPMRFPWETGFSKDRIAAVCGISPEKKPHRAMHGVDHLILCYQAVVGFPEET